MLRLWLLWLLWLPWVLSAADRCDLHHSTHSVSAVSAVLKSLQCYNDFTSYFHCTWRNEPKHQSNQTLKLWLKAKNARTGLCEEYPAAAEGTSECRYKTKIFSLGTTYTAFFNETVRFCSSGRPTSLDLSTLLRARAPVNLTTSSSHSGDLITWSSPYPQSSALNNNITYELSYRADGHDWTSEKLRDNQKKLDKKELSPGHRHEARVRSRVRLGQWSHWSPTVSWYTQPDAETAPPVDCVLWGEQKVQCRWEQSIELVHLISYQLVCRHNHTLEKWTDCCEESTSSLKHQVDTVRFSCSLRLPQPLTSSLQVALVPTRSSKTFKSTKNIRPPPPTDVKMTEKGNNWIVDWTPPKMSFKDLDHELCYFSLEKEGLEQKCSDSPQRNHISEDLGILHIPQGSSSGTILGRSVRPSHRYRVKVRTHVLRPYEGMPSDWSAPVDWTSHAAVWPVSYWIYIFVAVLVTKVFLVLFIVPACRRKAVLWVESVPSPSKSKVILDIQTVINHKVKLYESHHSKALDMDSVSTCSSYVSFRSNKNPDPPQAEQTQWAEEDEDTEEEEEEEEEEAVDEGVWSCENIPVSPLSKGSMTFTGPYILCQSVKPNPEEHIPDQTELSCPDVGRPAAVRTVSLEEGYVRLPSHTLHRSVQDLLSQTRDIEERSIYSTEETQLCLSGDSKTLWPQGGAIQGSGYCQLPPDFTCAQPQIIV